MSLPLATIAVSLAAAGLKLYGGETKIAEFVQHPLDLLAGHREARGLEEVGERFRKWVEGNSPPHNEDLEKALARIAIASDVLCLSEGVPDDVGADGVLAQWRSRFRDVLGGPIPGLFAQADERTVRSALQAARMRLSELEKGVFPPLEITPSDLFRWLGQDGNTTFLGVNSLEIIERDSGAMPEAVRTAFRDRWFGYLCLTFKEELKTNDRTRRIFTVMQVATGFVRLESVVHEEAELLRLENREFHQETFRRLEEIRELLPPAPLTKESRPTLILDVFASRQAARFQSRRRSSDTGVNQLQYQKRIEDETLVIEPADPYLDQVRSAGELHPIEFWHSPWAGRFALPTLDIKLVNNTDRTLFFHEAIFRIRRSRVDPRPIPIITDPISMGLPLRNVGWGPLIDAVLRFTLTVPESVVPNWTPSQRLGPFELRLGDIVDQPNDSSLDPFLKLAGADMNTLRRLWQARYSSPSGVYFADTADLGQPFDEGYLKEDRVLGSLVSTGKLSVSRRMPRDEYHALKERALGPFARGTGVLAGELEYGEQDWNGQVMRRQNRFTVKVGVGLRHAGAPMPPTYTYQTRLEVDRDDYTQAVQLSQSVSAGATDRFLIVVGAEKASVHEFDLLLLYNDCERIESRPIRLELFVSRLDAGFCGPNI